MSDCESHMNTFFYNESNKVVLVMRRISYLKNKATERYTQLTVVYRSVRVYFYNSSVPFAERHACSFSKLNISRWFHLRPASGVYLI